MKAILEPALRVLREKKDTLEQLILMIERVLRDDQELPRNLLRLGGVAAGKAPSGNAGRAEPGKLKGLIISTLRKQRKPMQPAKIVDAVVAQGYGFSRRKVLYTHVYQTLQKSREIKKTREGFTLR